MSGPTVIRGARIWWRDNPDHHLDAHHIDPLAGSGGALRTAGIVLIVLFVITLFPDDHLHHAEDFFGRSLVIGQPVRFTSSSNCRGGSGGARLVCHLNVICFG